MKIDHSTFPPCRIEQRKFEWGEPYEVEHPIFDGNIDPDLSDLEFSVEAFLKNNFREQLLLFLNTLLNHEENERIENFHGKIDAAQRQDLISRIGEFLDQDSVPAPWVKYHFQSGEAGHFFGLEKVLGREVLKIKNIPS